MDPATQAMLLAAVLGALSALLLAALTALRLSVDRRSFFDAISSSRARSGLGAIRR